MGHRMRLGILLILILVGGLGIVFQQEWIGSTPQDTPANTQSPTSTHPPRHVFLIVVDTLRADRLSCYGYREHRTKNIDRLASMGVRFANANSVASWTRPSMAAIMTSLYPTQLGLVEQPCSPDRTFEWREKIQQFSHTLQQSETTLAEMLRESGFTTGAFVDQPALNHALSFQQGFDDWFFPASTDDIERFDPSKAFQRQRWPSLKYADQSDWALIRKFAEWLPKKSDEQNLFVWLHLLTPHVPYAPAAKYLPPTQPDSDSKPTLSQLYDGEIRAIDDMVGSILQNIEKTVGFEHSLIVFTSDHGEEFDDHEMRGHGHSLHREVTHVPLIIASPSLPAGRVVQPFVRTIDILPTILALTGSPSPPSKVEGVNLLPVITSGRATEPVYSEAMLYGSTERSMVEGGFKLMYDHQGRKVKLYEVSIDPNENTDLSQTQPQRVSSMMKRLEAFHAGLWTDYSERSSKFTDKPSAEDLQRNVEALRALGYVDE